MRGEGDDPSGGDPEANQVYDNLGQVFDYYADTFGRDSYDDAGAELIASINFCENPGTATHNAYWDGTQMKFGDGYASSLDVTAHELTHAVTNLTADLEYQCQSGALNEAMSDIFASNVDSDDWEIGEDLPGGALRDMANPANGDPPQPAHTDDFVEMPNDGSPFNDSGGVHYNSGIPNHAYYLMVQSIGRKAAEQIVYRALTEKLAVRLRLRGLPHRVARRRPRAVGRGQPRVPGHQRVLRGGRPRRDLGSSRGGGMLMRMTILAGLALALLAAGCGSDDEGGGGASGDEKAALSGPVTYERGGGLKGRRDRLVVQPDGSATLTVRDTTKSVTLTDKELATLADDLDQADLGSLPPDSTAEPPAPDTFGYRVSYGGDEVTTDDTAMPEQLRGLMARLGGLVERYEQ